MTECGLNTSFWMTLDKKFGGIDFWSITKSFSGSSTVYSSYPRLKVIGIYEVSVVSVNKTVGEFVVSKTRPEISGEGKGRIASIEFSSLTAHFLRNGTNGLGRICIQQSVQKFVVQNEAFMWRQSQTI